MRQVVVRRHAERQDRSNNQSHLSQAGVDLARRVGGSSGGFDLVVSSPLPRALETAIAMGFAVDKLLPALEGLTPAIEAEVPWDAGYNAWAGAYRNGVAVKSYADHLARALRALAERVPDGGFVLAITHGGMVEACAVGSAPDTDFAAWRGNAGYCEGVSLEYDDDWRCNARILSIDRSLPRASAHPAQLRE